MKRKLDHTMMQPLNSHCKKLQTELRSKKQPESTRLVMASCGQSMPLDVSCFSPLKSYYDAKLLEYTQSTGAREHLRKDLFVNMLCSVWKTGLSEQNVVAGFRATGIHPIDRSKYNTARLDKLKLKTYADWVSAGKPTDDNNQPILPTAHTQCLEMPPPPPAPENDETPAATTPKQIATTPLATSTPTDSPTPGCSFWQSPGSSSNEPVHVSSEDLKKITNKQLVDELLRRGDSALSLLFQCLSSNISQRGKGLAPVSLEAVLHSRGRAATPLTKKRKIIPMSSSVITDEKCRQKIAEMNVPKTKSNKKKDQTQKKSKKEAPKKMATGKKRKFQEEDEDSDSTIVSSVAMSEVNTSSDISLEDLLGDDLAEARNNLEEAVELPIEEAKEGREETEDRRKQTDDRGDEDTDNRRGEATEDRIEQATSQTINIDDGDIHKFVAVYYSHPKPHYYWGKIVKVFSNDEDTDTTQVEVDFLQKKTISSDPSAWTWTDKKVKEVLIIEKKFIVFGPVLPVIRKNLFVFPDVQAMDSLEKFEERDW